MAFTHRGDLFAEDFPHQHDTVEQARECEREADHAAWEMACERDAEAAVERFFEDRGYWEARAQEDIEAARGVIPFDVAYAAALA